MAYKALRNSEGLPCGSVSHHCHWELPLLAEAHKESAVHPSGLSREGEPGGDPFIGLL